MLSSYRHKAFEARRELELRLSLYSQLVKDGEMVEEKAVYLVGILREIAEDYEKLAKDEQMDNPS